MRFFRGHQAFISMVVAASVIMPIGDAQSQPRKFASYGTGVVLAYYADETELRGWSQQNTALLIDGLRGLKNDDADVIAQQLEDDETEFKIAVQRELGAIETMVTRLPVGLDFQFMAATNATAQRGSAVRQRSGEHPGVEPLSVSPYSDAILQTNPLSSPDQFVSFLRLVAQSSAGKRIILVIKAHGDGVVVVRPRVLTHAASHSDFELKSLLNGSPMPVGDLGFDFEFVAKAIRMVGVGVTDVIFESCSSGDVPQLGHPDFAAWTFPGGASYQTFSYRLALSSAGDPDEVYQNLMVEFSRAGVIRVLRPAVVLGILLMIASSGIATCILGRQRMRYWRAQPGHK
jgi:hypothetical protein